MVKLPTLYKVYDTLLLFMIIFSFRVPLLYNSTVLAGILLCIPAFYSPSFCKNLIAFSRNKNVIRVFIGMLIVLFCSFLVPVIYLTFDFSIIRPLVGQMPSFLVLILYFAFVITQKLSEDDCKKILFDVFLLQAFIQLVALLFPGFHSLIELGQDPGNVEISHSMYGGMRNMALASNQFFALASVYGLVVIIYLSEILRKKTFLVKDGIYLLFYTCGIILSGRTGFFGFVFGLLYLFLSHEIKFIRKLKMILWGLVLLGVTAVCVYSFVPEDSFIKTKILPFAFEFVYNYVEGEGLKTESTRGLLTMLNRDISLKTFLIGDGLYTNPDGSYYMHTDSGYFRMIFLFGIGGLFLFLYFQLTCLPYRYFCKTKEYQLLIGVIILYLLLLQVKGETLGYIKYVNSVIYYFFTSIYLIRVYSNSKV